VIFLDLMLPDSQGLSNIQKIKDVTDTPLIVVTGQTNPDFGVQSIALGAEDFVFKENLESSVLVKAVAYALNRQRYKMQIKKAEAAAQLANENAKSSQERQAFLYSVLQGLTDFIFVVQSDGRIKTINESAIKALNLKPKPLKQLNLADCFAEGKGKTKGLTFENLLKSAESNSARDINVDLLTSAGEKIPTLMTASPLKDASGKAEALILSCKDLRESNLLTAMKKRLEMDLQASQTRLTSIIETMGDGLCVVSVSGEYLMVNDQAKIALGFDPADSGRDMQSWPDFFGIFDPINKHKMSANRLPIVRAFKGERVNNMRLFVKNPYRPDGIYLSVTATPLREANGKVYAGVCVFRDTTEEVESERNRYHLILAKEKADAAEKRAQDLLRHNQEIKSAQDQLVQSAKLASLGELSSGLAHELNNPLFLIAGFAARIQETCEQDSPPTSERLNPYVAQITNATNRMSRIIERFREFSRRSDHKSEAIEIDQVIQNAFILFEEQLRLKGIELQQDLAAQGAMILGDGTRIEQVLVNLLTNAMDAVEAAHGKGAGFIKVSTTVTDERLGITVEDNGKGIKANIKDKIFDPFFTTKEVGKGTGLGLSISFGIIKEHGGEIKVSSRNGKGTCFTIALPLAVGASHKKIA
jgi:PAS domain S-box-containing protein